MTPCKKEQSLSQTWLSTFYLGWQWLGPVGSQTYAVGLYQWARLEKPVVLAKPLVASPAGSR
jgi:hypothetical protein